MSLFVAAIIKNNSTVCFFCAKGDLDLPIKSEDDTEIAEDDAREVAEDDVLVAYTLIIRNQVFFS